MKKLFLLFATVTLFVGFQACKQQEEAPAEEATEVTTEAAATEAPAADSAATGDSSRAVVPPVTPQ